MRKAFSLAEVLVTLTILGVIFTCTMPVLNITIKDKENYTKARKTYTVLSDAMTLAYLRSSDASEHVVVDGSDANMKIWFDRFLKPNLNINKVCYNKAGCWNNGNTYKLSGPAVSYNVPGVGVGYGIITAVLSDGTLINIDGYSKTDIKNIFGVDIPSTAGLALFYDVNGGKNPNTVGKDIFVTVYYDDTLVPAYSSKTKEEVFADCSKSGSGYACLQKMIYDDTQTY